MKKVLSLFQGIGNVLNVVAIAATLVMVCLTIADVLLRAIFKSPITGTVEIARMMMVCMSASFASAVMENRHVDVGLIVDNFPEKVQLGFAIFGHLISAAICALMCYQGFVDMAKKMSQHQVYTMLNIPTWPFYLIFAIAMGVFALSILVKLLEKIVMKNEQEVEQA